VFAVTIQQQYEVSPDQIDAFLSVVERLTRQDRDQGIRVLDTRAYTRMSTQAQSGTLLKRIRNENARPELRRTNRVFVEHDLAGLQDYSNFMFGRDTRERWLRAFAGRESPQARLISTSVLEPTRLHMAQA
jgi:hypothetical protein